MTAGPDVAVAVIRTDGSTEFKQLGRDDVRAWQAEVGGYLEPIYGNGWTGFVNEEASMLREPPEQNMLAHFVLAWLRWYPPHGQVLLGNLVLCGPADSAGNVVDVPSRVIDAVERAAAAYAAGLAEATGEADGPVAGN